MLLANKPSFSEIFSRLELMMWFTSIFSILPSILFFAFFSFQQYAPLLAVFSTQGQSELILLQKVQEYCYDNIHFMKAFQKIVVLFYKGKRLYLWLCTVCGFSVPTRRLARNRKRLLWVLLTGRLCWVELWNSLCSDSSKEHVAAGRAKTRPSLSLLCLSCSQEAWTGSKCCPHSVQVHCSPCGKPFLGRHSYKFLAGLKNRLGLDFKKPSKQVRVWGVLLVQVFSLFC